MNDHFNDPYCKFLCPKDWHLLLDRVEAYRAQTTLLLRGQTLSEPRLENPYYRAKEYLEMCPEKMNVVIPKKSTLTISTLPPKKRLKKNPNFQ